MNEQQSAGYPGNGSGPEPDTAKAGAVQPNQSWPQHPLMQANPEHSLDVRYLAKPIYETMLIDDMEQDGNWSASPTVQMEYTTERARSGTRSLRFRVNQRNEEYIRASRAPNGSFSGGGILIPGQPFCAFMRLKFDSPQDWTRFNRLSLWCYVHPTPAFLPHTPCIWFQCDGAPIGPTDPMPWHFVPDLRVGEWNHIVWEIPEFPRDNVSELVIFQQIHGVPYQGDGTLTYDFDQIQLERVDVETYEGWEVSPGKIAFNHVGYLPAGEKIAFASEVTARAFDVIDEASGKSVASFPVQSLANRRGHFQIFDFSAFTTPGRYRLRCGDLTSGAFSISDELWYGPIEKSLNFFYAMRCGFAIPGIHDTCHLDARTAHGDETRFIDGGWHDAAGLGQGSFETMLCAYYMLELYEQLKEHDIKPDLQARVLEEARWGVEWVLKVRFGNGWRVLSYADDMMYTDNQLGTIDDAIFPSENAPFENFLSAMLLARAARIFKSMDSAFSAQLLQAAEDDYASTEQARSGASPSVSPSIRGGSTQAWRDELAYATLAAVELYRATGQQSYADEAPLLVRRLLAQQEQRFVDGIPITGYFYEDPEHRRIQHDYHTCYEEAAPLALRAFCETWPDHPDWMHWYAAVVLHSEFFYRRGAQITAPYRMLPSAVWRRQEIESLIAELTASGEPLVPPPVPSSPFTPEVIRREIMQIFEAATPLGENYRLRAFPIWLEQLAHGNTNVQLTGTLALAVAMHLRNAANIESLMAKQLQWIFGGNPFSQSLMFGEGYDFQHYYIAASPNLVGALPVGMNSLHSDAPFWSAVKQPAHKEVWGIPGGHFLGVLASMALPARVMGAAPAGAAFQQAQTGKVVRVDAGEFALNLPPGDYTIEYGTFRKRLTLVAGGSYQLTLDPQHAIEVELAASPLPSERVQVEVHVSGVGVHSVELRVFNGAVEQPRREVQLVPERVETLTWSLKIAQPDTPWVIVVIPDRSMSDRREVCGAFGELTTLV